MDLGNRILSGAWVGHHLLSIGDSPAEARVWRIDPDARRLWDAVLLVFGACQAVQIAAIQAGYLA